MNITCISAANVEPARQHSASLRTCELIRDLLPDALAGAMIDIVPLIDFELTPCRMCGQCFQSQRCARDDGFNQIFEKMLLSDGLFFVVPHYAPLPSKLMMLFEKMEEIAFLNWCADPAYRFPLSGIPAGVIGHGGQETSPESIGYYQRALVEPVAQALRSVSMRVIGVGEDEPNGVAFGIQALEKRSDSIFVDIRHDWDDVQARIAPLVRNVAGAIQ